jgi:hypothetical protein
MVKMSEKENLEKQKGELGDQLSKYYGKQASGFGINCWQSDERLQKKIDKVENQYVDLQNKLRQIEKVRGVNI